MTTLVKMMLLLSTLQRCHQISAFVPGKEVFSMRRGLNLSSVLNRSSFPRRKIGHGFENYIGSLFSSSKRHIEKEVMPMIIRLSIPTADDLEDVGALLAVISHPPDALFLDGDLGAGKTTFARGFILCKLGRQDGVDEQSLRITSPTYLLSNTYKYQDRSLGDKEQEIHHMDLYRLSATSQSEFDPLQLNHVFSNCISLVEWPNRLDSTPQLLPPHGNRLYVNLAIRSRSDTRILTLQAPPGSTWEERLRKLREEGMFEDLIRDDFDEVKIESE